MTAKTKNQDPFALAGVRHPVAKPIMLQENKMTSMFH